MLLGVSSSSITSTPLIKIPQFEYDNNDAFIIIILNLVLMLTIIIMSLRAFFYTALSAAIEKKLAVSLLTKKTVRVKQPCNLFPTLKVVRVEQIKKNGKFPFLSFA